MKGLNYFLTDAQVPNEDRHEKRRKWRHAHAPSAVLAFSDRFSVFVWKGENDSKAERIKFRFQMKKNTCGRGFRPRL